MPDSLVVSLGARVPVALRQRMRRYCAYNDLEMQDVLAAAVTAYLDRLEGTSEVMLVDSPPRPEPKTPTAGTRGWTCPLDDQPLQSLTTTTMSDGRERTRFVHRDGSAHGDTGQEVWITHVDGSSTLHQVRDVEHRPDGTVVYTMDPDESEE